MSSIGIKDKAQRTGLSFHLDLGFDLILNVLPANSFEPGISLQKENYSYYDQANRTEQDKTEGRRQESGMGVVVGSCSLEIGFCQTCPRFVINLFVKAKNPESQKQSRKHKFAASSLSLPC